MYQSMEQKKNHILFLAVAIMSLFLILSLQSKAATTTYYIDSVNGMDSNDGLSSSSPFKTLNKLNSMTFQAGDKILFKEGCTWEGEFTPKGSGTDSNPIIVNAYDDNGKEVTGEVQLDKKPYIKNDGTDQSGDSRVQFQYAYAIHLKNVEYWELNNLQCSVDNDNVWQGTFGDLNHNGNKWTSSTNKGRNWVGIMVEARDYNNNGDKTIDHVYIKNCYVHDVDGNYALWHKDGFSGGITYLIWTDAMKDGNLSPQEASNIPINTFNDVLVENCYLKDTSRAGITIGTSIWEYKFNGYGGVYPQDLMDTYASDNVIIRNNVVDRCTGDGIEVLYTKSPLIEYNMAMNPGQDMLGNNSDEFTSAGIWCWRSPNALFQYNESYGCDNFGDGQAWDVDWTYDVIYQYNYSHDNRNGSVLFCLGESLESTYRYNISINDGTFVDDLSAGPGNKLYNNTFIAGPKTYRVFRRKGGPQSFTNNIFYVPSGKSITSNWDYNDTYSHNLYYNLSTPNDSHKVIGDPKFTGSIDVVTGTYARGPHNTANYLATVLAGVQIADDSPCINKGKVINNPGTKDFFGNSLYTQEPDIGACEHPNPSPNPGSNNLVIGKVATASNVHSDSYKAEKAIDGDSYTRWATSNVTSCWLQVDFDEITSFNRIKISEFDNRVQQFQIQYLDNGTWKNAYTGTTIGDLVEFKFDTVSSNKIRLNIKDATMEPTIYELEVYYDKPENLAIGKTVTVSNQHDSGLFNGDKLVDNDLSTRWATIGVTTCWAVIDFGKDVAFNKVVINEFSSRVRDFAIEYWDGSTWVEAHAGTTIGSNYEATFNTVTSSKIRLNIKEATTEPTIYEIEVY